MKVVTVCDSGSWTWESVARVVAEVVVVFPIDESLTDESGDDGYGCTDGYEGRNIRVDDRRIDHMPNSDAPVRSRSSLHTDHRSLVLLFCYERPLGLAVGDGLVTDWRNDGPMTDDVVLDYGLSSCCQCG